LETKPALFVYDTSINLQCRVLRSRLPSREKRALC
jgi:hypothetical protein